MASYNILPIIYQDRDIETKCFDTLSDLAYLLVSMDSRVFWVRFERCCGEISYLQGCRHVFLRCTSQSEYRTGFSIAQTTMINSKKMSELVSYRSIRD
jgi:hypothetical protein